MGLQCYIADAPVVTQRLFLRMLTRPSRVRDLPMHRSINPATIPAPLARYSHAIQVPPGAELLVTSGQLGIGPGDHVPDDVEAQCVLCFENLKAILAGAGMSFADVIRFNAFVTDRAFFPIYGAVRSRYVEGDTFASTLVIVSGFTRPEFKVEVEVTAAKVRSK
jgi:enamine deaminase RidA (YjgF/YER057c/UK114 family)